MNEAADGKFAGVKDFREVLLEDVQAYRHQHQLDAIFTSVKLT